MGQIVIAGFSSTDRVPGFYGETKFGVGATSASSIPLQMLVTGLKTSGGSAVADQDVIQIFSTSDADAYFGAGSELACECYVALKTPGVSLWAAATAAPGSPTAATLTVTLTGTWSTSGTYTYRINGETRSVTINAADSLTQAAATIVADIQSQASWPVTASNSSGVITLAHKTASARGNQQIFFQDVSLVPAGFVSTISAGTALQTANANGSYMAGGVGASNVTNLLALISTTQYDRIAAAENDATNIARWKTQLDAQSGPTVGILGHLVFATNGSYSNAQGLSFTTVNHPRFQQVWSADNEMHPSAIAASFGAMRCAKEQNDPNASFDDDIVPGVPPQALKADWPSHPTQVAAVNNGITFLYSTPDGYCKVGRSIVTKCNVAGTPNYATLDTSDAVVPDFVRTTLKLYWVGTFKPNNPRNADNPSSNERRPPSGVATPDTWNTSVYGILKDLESGANFPAPIIQDVESHLPVSTFDKVAKRIMSAVTVVPAANNHQIGVSVRQAAA